MAPKTQDELLSQAKARVAHHSDPPTIFFVDFIPSADGSARTELKKVKQDIATWRQYLAALTGIKLQELINEGELPSSVDATGEARRSSYHSKIFAQLIRGISRPWMNNKSTEQQKQGEFSCTKAELRSQVVAKVLDGFVNAKSAVTTLEKPLRAICGDIARFPTPTASRSVQYVLVLTRFDCQKTIEPAVRIVTFNTTADLKKVTEKESSDSVKLNFEYTQYDSNFNIDIFRHVASGLSTNTIQGGSVFINKSAEIEVTLS